MQRLEDTDLFTFKSRVMRLDLGGIKSLYREIYDAKAARGRTWNMETIIKVEKMETFVRKALSGKGLLNKKEQQDFATYMQDVQKIIKR